MPSRSVPALRALAKGFACLSAVSALILSGCDLLGKSGEERPVILHLSLDDSLSYYDSVLVALTPFNDPSTELEYVHRGFLASPKVMPAYTVKRARDPFIVKVEGFRKVSVGMNPREQLAVSTLILYEGGRKQIRRPLVPAQVPFNYLARLAAGTGSLTPIFNPSVQDYTLRLARGTTSVILDIEAEYPKAAITVGGEAVLPGANKRTVAVAGKDTLVTITVTDLLQPRSYQVLVSPEKALPLALDSVWNSVGTLAPAFHPDSLAYQLILPSVISSVNFKLWPADPPNTAMTFQGSAIFPGAQRTVYVDTAGATVTAIAVLTRSNVTREYRFQVTRSP